MVRIYERDFVAARRVVGGNDSFERWCDIHETHEAVAVAIFAIANQSSRTPDDVWDDPGFQESEVVDALADYLTSGAVEPEDDDTYPWGKEGSIIMSKR